MKRHEKKPYSIDMVTEKIEYHSTVDVAALKNERTIWNASGVYNVSYRVI